MKKHQKNISNQQILDAISGLGNRVGNLEESNQLILKSVNDFSTEVDQKFSKIDGRLSKVESTMTTKDDLKKFATKKDLKGLENKIDGLESRMVSKSYLDDKLADLQADLAIDKKIKTLTNILHHRQVINSKDVKVVFSV